MLLNLNYQLRISIINIKILYIHLSLSSKLTLSESNLLKRTSDTIPNTTQIKYIKLSTKLNTPTNI